jgi:hypothetical protein
LKRGWKSHDIEFILFRAKKIYSLHSHTINCFFLLFLWKNILSCNSDHLFLIFVTQRFLQTDRKKWNENRIQNRRRFFYIWIKREKKLFQIYFTSMLVARSHLLSHLHSLVDFIDLRENTKKSVLKKAKIILF